MFDRLYAFLYKDYRARWKAFNWTMVATFVYCGVSNGMLRRSLVSTSKESFGVAALSMLAWVSWYIYRPVLTHSEDVSARTRRVLLGYALALASVFAIILLGQESVASLKAAVLDRELNELLAGPLDDVILVRRGDMLVTKARTQGVQVNPRVIKKVGYKLLVAAHGPALPEIWVFASDLAGYRSTLSNASTFSDAPKPGLPPKPGEPGCTFTMDLVGPPLTDEQVKALALPKGAFVTRTPWLLWITNCTLDLEIGGKPWQKTWVSESVVEYKGGPLELDNVRFDNCRFDFPIVHGRAFDNQKALLAALLSSNIVTITLLG